VSHDDQRRTAEAVEDIGFGILRKRLCVFCGFCVDAVGVIAP
jgi:formate hydrogenlyase subunit 6/NADH:ubiquinone oxidoreductase subunit I